MIKQYAEDYIGEYKTDTIVITNNKKTESKTFIPNNIKHKNSKHIAVCYCDDTVLPFNQVDISGYPSFSYNKADFTITETGYKHNEIHDIIPYNPHLTDPALLIYITSFYKFETIFMFGLSVDSNKQIKHIDEIIKAYTDTDFINVTITGNEFTPERWKWLSNFHQVSWSKFKTLIV